MKTAENIRLLFIKKILEIEDDVLIQKSYFALELLNAKEISRQDITSDEHKYDIQYKIIKGQKDEMV